MKLDKSGRYCIQVRLTPSEYESARALAYEKGVTVNQLLKLLLLEKK